MLKAKELIRKIHGSNKPFEVLYIKSGSIVWSEKFQTHHLAWAAGENWKMLNPEHSYSIQDKQ